MGMNTMASALCALGQPNWPVRSQNLAQGLARKSAASAVRQAYGSGHCTITAILHQNGGPCLRNSGNNHVTVRIDGINGAFHVFNYKRRNSRFYCTTH
jgi:hypothetical protein